MIVVMTGLPGTGKSAIAEAVCERIGGTVLSKDVVRSALFPKPFVEYSTEQDDFCIDIMLRVAEWLLIRHPALLVFLDGRTFSRNYQIRAVKDAAARLRTPCRVIECVCREETARKRLDLDVAAGTHPARNRTFALYQDVRAHFEAVPEPKFVIDTDRPVEDCVHEAMEWLTQELSAK